MRRCLPRGAHACLALVLLVTGTASAQHANRDWNGHTKLRVLADSYPEGSVFRDLVGSTSADVEGDLRLNASVGSTPWSVVCS